MVTPPDYEKITTVIISDRIEGIVTTLGSMIRSTSSSINVILIGNQETNEKAQEHFHDRTSSFIAMTVEEIQADLIAQGFDPIWNWREWHSSRDPEWKNENTLHVAEWDDLHTHDHELSKSTSPYHLHFDIVHFKSAAS